MAQYLDVRKFSRREFLKFSSATLLSLLILSHPSLAYAANSQKEQSETRLGRIVKNKIKMYDSPSIDGKVLRSLSLDDIFSITDTSIAEGDPLENLTWYELDGLGYVHSGSVQPVEYRMNDIVKSIPTTGLLSEVSVPYTDALYDPNDASGASTRLYYATTHWILGVFRDDTGQWWYEVLEDFYRKSYYVKTQHLRVIPADETSTLSPDVPASDKKLEVRLNQQVVIAYEGDAQVQLFRCSAGIIKKDECLTPAGTFRTDYKRPSRHMIDGNDHHANTFNLPGVPWISYLDENGISFHGTYWHNNFGVAMSHGCVNLPPEAAKWIYRWTLPVVPHEEQRGYQMNGGTKVIIH